MKDKHWTLLVGALIVLGLGYAWLHRHPVDDAFITFRYSKHLVQGWGPVWNADQRVEGYTNFLWMLLMALPIGVGWDPIVPAILLSLGCLALNLWLLYRISSRQTGSAAKGFWAWLPVMCSHTLLFSSTSGLETALNGLLWTATLWQLQSILQGDRLSSSASLWLLGITAGVAVLSRPEGGLLVMACMVGILIQRHKLATKLLHFCAALALVTLPWLVWKFLFYGQLLPNTFHVKTASSSFKLGLHYCMTFLLVSGCWVPEVVIRITRTLKSWNFDHFQAIAIGLTLCFLGYAVAAGGDYLEFRLLVPILPFVMMVPAWRLAHRARKMRQVVVAASVMAGVATLWGQGHGRLFKIWYLNPVVHPSNADQHFMSFSAQGKALGELLGHDPSIRLAIGACGAIPYYTNCYGIDLYGLNEPQAEFSSYETGYGPGHARLADFEFIRQRKPHLISLRCAYLPHLPSNRHYTLDDPQIAETVHGADPLEIPSLQIIELPLGKGFVEVCLYYQPHPRIDSILKSNSLTIYHLE